MKKNLLLFLFLILGLGTLSPVLVLAVNLNSSDDNLIPATATSENTQQSPAIAQVQLNSVFYQPGAKTTRLDQIKDATKVEGLTLDVPGKVKVSFAGSLNLADPVAVQFIIKINDYLNFDHLYFQVKQELLDYFKVPLQVTFYDLPFVWAPDILQNDRDTLTKDNFSKWTLETIDDKVQLSLVINKGGSYKIVPHFELSIVDSQVVKTQDKATSFNGRISDPEAVIKINFNGQDLDNIKPVIDPQTGEFSFGVPLVEGVNLIVANAQSQYGQLPKITKIVRYNPAAVFKPQGQTGISPINIIGIVIAVLIIVLLFIWRQLARKRRR